MQKATVSTMAMDASRSLLDFTTAFQLACINAEISTSKVARLAADMGRALEKKVVSMPNLHISIQSVIGRPAISQTDSWAHLLVAPHPVPVMFQSRRFCPSANKKLWTYSHFCAALRRPSAAALQSASICFLLKNIGFKRPLLAYSPSAFQAFSGFCFAAAFSA
jgi:hypothetical protein